MADTVLLAEMWFPAFSVVTKFYIFILRRRGGRSVCFVSMALPLAPIFEIEIKNDLRVNPHEWLTALFARDQFVPDEIIEELKGYSEEDRFVLTTGLLGRVKFKNHDVETPLLSEVQEQKLIDSLLPVTPENAESIVYLQQLCYYWSNVKVLIDQVEAVPQSDPEELIRARFTTVRLSQTLGLLHRFAESPGVDDLITQSIDEINTNAEGGFYEFQYPHLADLPDSIIDRLHPVVRDWTLHAKTIQG